MDLAFILNQTTRTPRAAGIDSTALTTNTSPGHFGQYASHPQARIPVDESEEREGAPDIDERILSYTESIRSTFEYPMENGRRYHAYRSGTYILPNDEAEMDRLDFCHALLVKTIGDRLYLAPIQRERTRRILDIGTGTGIWAMQMADLFPEAEIIGNDLSGIQPSGTPSNVVFEIDDVESEWVGEGFDFIFSRYMCGSIVDWPTYVRRVYENLKPGGWAEFQDWSFMIYSDDGSIEGTNLLRWVNLFMDACRISGRDGQIGPKLERLVKENTGLVNIQHRPFKIPAGPWAKDPYLKHIGMYELVQLLEGLEAFSLRLLCGSLGWTKEEVYVLLAQVRKDLKNPSIHAWLYYNVVYGQKSSWDA